ncbi:MAG: hypothetical protein WAM39_21710 [Bryobacteraceae bacterium]
MEALHVCDESSEQVRVAIRGTLSGSLVKQLQETWEAAQSNEFWRRFVVDISGLAGYDSEGHELLHLLHSHGAIFAAGTPRSLDYLEEITSGTLKRALSLTPRRSVDRASSPRPRHRAGLGTYEAATRYR